MIAYRMEDGERCSMCGTANWEWEEDKRAYTPSDHMCWGCYYLRIHEESAGERLPGTTTRLVPTESAVIRKMQEREERFRDDD